MLLFLMDLAAACDTNLLSSIPIVDPGASDVLVTAGRGVVHSPTAGGADVVMAGARAVARSNWPVSYWQKVLASPETQDDWQPEEMGTRRVERLDAQHIFQQSLVKALGGAVSIRRQSVAEIHWQYQSNERLKNCWFASDPTPYLGATAAWADDSPWLLLGFGGWDVNPLPEGGTLVSYQMWVEASIIPSSMLSWAISRSMPNMMHVFDARVAEVNGALSPQITAP